MFLETFQQVLKLFTFMAIGFALNKFHKVPNLTTYVLSQLEVNCLIPCLSFRTFSTNFTPEKLSSVPQLMLVSIICLPLMWLLAIFVGRRISKDHYTQNVAIYSMSVPNTGYVGTPLILSMYGGEMLMHYSLFAIPLSIYTYTAGMQELLDQKKVQVKNFFSMPMIAIYLGMLFGLLRIPVTGLFKDVIDGCANCMSPLAMLLTGCVIAEFDFRKLLGDWHVYAVVALRMIVTPLIFCTIGYFLHLPRTIMIVMVGILAMPTGLNTVIFPASVGKDCHLGAGMACVSNTLAVLTVPLLFSLYIR